VRQLVTEAQLGSAKGQLRQATAALDQASINLAHTRITAPVDGTVIARRMDVGQTVAASFAAPTVFEIAQDLTKMQLDTNVDESDVGNIRVGQDSTFTVDAYPANTFTGKVTDVRKAPIVTQNVVTYDVVISVSNLDLRLFPGMTANVRILTTRVDNTLTVPNTLLRLHPSADTLKRFGFPVSVDKDTIYVVRNRKLEAVPVVFGISDGKSTAVRSNQLQAGENVVVRFAVGLSAIPSKATMPVSGTTRRTPGL
jgi:HlyD family secretion protein